MLARLLSFGSLFKFPSDTLYLIVNKLLSQRFGPSCVLLKRVQQGRTESEGIVLAANAGPRVPSGGVSHLFDCQ